ncbi:MAG: DUF2461 domain-containing protein [Clostridiales bacterium]|jgi:uncharacterized protein (TIGR02453 family)|nr:DUF2461 domain-containing protein [Clostridiales bacterium]
MPIFEGFSQATLDFMWNLRFNNNKPWFEAHKAEFTEVFQTPMKALGHAVFERIDANFRGHGFIHKVSRIYKDARRVKGGEPYRCNLWFSIERPVAEGKEWTAAPVFWFELTPENWTYGLGYYAARAETMAKLRARIDKHPQAFEKRIAPLEKQNEFVLDGAEYVRKKEAPTEKTAGWYNKKSFSLIHEQKHGNELFSADLADRIVKGYTFLMPFYDYFITLDSDPPVNQPTTENSKKATR